MVLFVVTQNQDRSTRMASEHTVTALLAHESARLGTLALDYARWDAAVENLVIAFDETWADDNVGTYLAETYDISSSYVVNGRDDVVFAMAGNKILGARSSASRAGHNRAARERYTRHERRINPIQSNDRHG